MKVTLTSDGILMEFSKQTNSKGKVFLFSEAIISLGSALGLIFCAYEMLNTPGDYLVVSLFLLCVAFISLIVFKRYINKATAKESLYVTSHTLSIINTAILQKSEEKYNIINITNLQFRGRQQMTDHPLKGVSFDYMGFQSQQEIINTVHDEGNISFEYKDKTIFFGKSVPSWDAEEIDKAIRQITNSKLYIENLPESIEEIETEI